jgi:hypothetical protein
MGFYASSGESKLNNSQKYSNINNLPIQGVCATADGNPTNTKAHLSVCISVDTLDDTLLDVTPYYFKKQAEMEEWWKAAIYRQQESLSENEKMSTSSWPGVAWTV